MRMISTVSAESTIPTIPRVSMFNQVNLKQVHEGSLFKRSETEENSGHSFEASSAALIRVLPDCFDCLAVRAFKTVNL